MTSQSFGFTPREIVSELDRYIVGQDRAKRAVAIALRNRWRRQQVPADIRDEIMPKNIIMIGPTGVGKTEVARRLAKLAGAPFVKVEASKFTEVGYVGRDVESIIRDLVELAVQMVRSEHVERVKARAADHAEDRLIELILAQRNAHAQYEVGAQESPAQAPAQGTLPQMFGPFVIPAMGMGQAFPGTSHNPSKRTYSEEDIAGVRQQLRAQALDEESVELEVSDNSSPLMSVVGVSGMEGLESQLKDVFNQIPGFKGRTKPRKVKVPEARKILQDEEAQKLIDLEGVQREAVQRTEEAGIVFLDEIDKVAGRQTSQAGPDVSREGVQRDLLPIVEGSSVSTKYGAVRTDHILFIAAGAFHVSKVSDLIPELQGRFPIRVELDSLGKKELVRILTEPKNALTRQYEALLKTEGVTITFSGDAIDAIAEYATSANQRAENIGARRLHTMMEALLEEMSFAASDMGKSELKIDAAYVKDKLGAILQNEDMARYIL